MLVIIVCVSRSWYSNPESRKFLKYWSNERLISGSVFTVTFWKSNLIRLSC
jgi:uncharacterized protein Usg